MLFRSCSPHATVSAHDLCSGSLDYVQFCGATTPVNALDASHRVAVDRFAEILGGNPDVVQRGGRGRGRGRGRGGGGGGGGGAEESTATNSIILIDVREKTQFDICNLDSSINVPFSTISRTPAPSHNTTTAFETGTTNTTTPSRRAADDDDEPDWVSELRSRPETPIYVVCRLGNDSQLTVQKMQSNPG